MKIVDITEITVSSGSGGNGAVAFRREKHVPNGGPSGGDGGRGGSVIFEASEDLHTLLDFRYKHHFRADDGQRGDIKNRHGKKGEDLIIPVPVGTVIRERESEKVICDLSEKGQRFTAAKGGRGGRGNPHFMNAVHQAPRYAEPGEKGRTRELILELKSIADVGLVGLPNAGKSSLLSILSAAKPKIANYPFTTLRPNLGVVKLPEGDGFVVADIPGLIEGASEGVGLGHDFLRHIERTRLLIHLVDGADGDPVEKYQTIQQELKAYPADLQNKPQILVINKNDLLDDGDREILKALFAEVTSEPLHLISAATQMGMPELIRLIQQRLAELPPIPVFEAEIEEEDEAEQESHPFEISKEGDIYIVECEDLERQLMLADLDDPPALRRFQKQLYGYGIIDALKAHGAGSGDSVRIGDLEFDYL